MNFEFSHFLIGNGAKRKVDVTIVSRKWVLMFLARDIKKLRAFYRQDDIDLSITLCTCLGGSIANALCMASRTPSSILAEVTGDSRFDLDPTVVWFSALTTPASTNNRMACKSKPLTSRKGAVAELCQLSPIQSHSLRSESNLGHNLKRKCTLP